MHGGLVVEVRPYREVAAFLISYDLVVALHFLALQSQLLALDRLLHAVLHVAQHGSDGQHGLFLHILGWNYAVDGHVHPTLFNLQHRRHHRHVLFLHRLQFGSPRRQRHSSQQHQ